MPLLAANLEQAALAYGALEQRAQAAEQRIAALEATLAQAQAIEIPPATRIRLLNQHVLDLETRNINLQTQVQQVAQANTDMVVSEFAEMISVGVEIAEAVMPERSVSSIGGELRSYLLPQQGGFGLRLPQPELPIEAGELSSTSIQMSKVPPPADSRTSSKSFYLVLIEKQALYGSPQWSSRKGAAALVSGIVGLFTDTRGWGGVAIPQAAAAVATLELAFAEELSATPPAELSQYRTSASTCKTLAEGVVARAKLVPGDIRAVTSALDQTTIIAQGWST